VKTPRPMKWTLPALLCGVVTALPAYAEVPCCSVVSYQPVDGIVVVRNLTTGRETKVTVTDKALLQSLKVGQQVELDAKGRIQVPSLEPPHGLRLPAR
jgi:hypothetical protein